MLNLLLMLLLYAIIISAVAGVAYLVIKYAVKHGVEAALWEAKEEGIL